MKCAVVLAALTLLLAGVKSYAQQAPADPRTIYSSVSLNALTAETYDQIYNSIYHTETSRYRKLKLTGSFGKTMIRSFIGDTVLRTKVAAYTFDTQYRKDLKKSYRFVSANGSITSIIPGSSAYPSPSGYYSIAVGVGRRIAPNIDGEVGLGHVKVYTQDVETKLTPVYAMRMTRQLSSTLKLNSDIQIINPFESESLIDSHVDMNYQLTKSIGLTLSYKLNNITAPYTTHTGWDKVLRMLVTFSRSTTK